MTKPTGNPKGRPYADTVRTVLYLPRELREQFADNQAICDALEIFAAEGQTTMTTITMQANETNQIGALLLLSERMNLRSGKSCYEIVNEPVYHETNLHRGQVIAGPLYQDALSNTACSLHVGRVRSIRNGRMIVEILPQATIRELPEIAEWLTAQYGVRPGSWGSYHVWVTPA